MWSLSDGRLVLSDGLVIAFLLHMIIYCFSAASVAFLLMLNIDKFTCIQWPLQYPMWVTEKRIAIATTVMWLFVAGVVGYAFYGCSLRSTIITTFSFRLSLRRSSTKLC